QNLESYLDGFFDVEQRSALKVLTESLASQKLGRDVVLPTLEHATRHDGTHVGMIDGVNGPGLSDEPIHRRRITTFSGEHLDRSGVGRAVIECFVNAPTTAVAQKSTNLET